MFFVEAMQNEYQQITNPTEFNDQEKIDQALVLLSNNSQPTFIHIHWLGTHGPRFHPKNRVFSISMDATQQAEWEIPFYEDAILDFDGGIEHIFLELEKAGILDETVIIIGSDHGMGFVTSRRTPLIMFFPYSENNGKIVVDTQNLDIGPTVLDYLRLAIPKWMNGQSLIRQIVDYRPIIGVRTGNAVGVEGQGWVLDEKYNQPPFYQFDYIGVVNCGVWTQLRLEDYSWTNLRIDSYNSTCRSEDILSGTEIRQSIIKRLQLDGFEFDEHIIPIAPSTN